MCDINRFYICKFCGNVIGMIHDAGVPIMCCGEEMTMLEPHTKDGGQEKHAPVVCVEDNIVYVSVGSAHHPMEEAHSIQWVYLQTDKGGHRKRLEIGNEPTVRFSIVDEKPLAVYAYCNQHGLWKTDI